jgi:hypothetical protein
MSRRWQAVALLLGIVAISGVAGLLARSGTVPWLGDVARHYSPWIGILVVLLPVGATVFTTKSQAMRWLCVLMLLLGVGSGIYLWWHQHRVEQAQGRLAVLTDWKARQENWKERWEVKYGEYRKLREAGEKPPAALLTEVTRLRLELIGLAYRKAALGKGPPQHEGDLGKDVPDWKYLGKEKPLVIIWGVDRAYLTEGGSRALLAWEANDDETGHRCVLMADGTTEFVDDETFRGMPKAADQ